MHHTEDKTSAFKTLRRSFALQNGGALTFLLFLLTRPYIGIQHDARLYIGFALAKLDPNGIGRDLVFTADGQSGYSIFPPILLVIVEWLGPSHAAMLVPAVGLIAWYCALRLFVVHILPPSWTDKQVNAAIVAALSLTPFYGGTGVLKFAEPYATPRVFAEALVLLALTMCMRASRMQSLPLLVAAAVHPLMTAPSIGVAFLMKVRSHKHFLALIALAILGGAVLLGLSASLNSEAAVLARFDDAWLQVLNFKRTLVFLRFWSSQDFARTLVHFATLAMAWQSLGDSTRRLISAVFAVVALGLLATWIGADLVGNILFAQAQLWRGMWMLALVAALSVPVVLHSAWRTDRSSDSLRGSETAKAASLLLLLAWVLAEINANAGMLALVACLLWYAERIGTGLRLPDRGTAIVGAVVAVLLVGVLGVQAWVATGVAWSSPDTSMRFNWNYWLLTGIPGALMLAGSLHPLLESSPPFQGRWATPATVVIAFVVCWKLDSRSQYQRYIEDALDSYIATGTTLIPSNGTAIVWPYADMEPWALGGSPSWGSIPQGIPAVFSRELALSWYQRWTYLERYGVAARGEGRLSVVGGGERSVIVPCPAFETESANIVQPSDSGTIRLGVPKPVQPRSLGLPWKQQTKLVFRICPVHVSSATESKSR